MIKIGHLNDLDEHLIQKIESTFSERVKNDVCKMLEILDGYYGKDRDIYNNDGGYLVLLENKDDWNTYNEESHGMLKRNNYDVFLTFFNFVRVDYVVNNETIISVYMSQNLFNEV